MKWKIERVSAPNTFVSSYLFTGGYAAGGRYAACEEFKPLPKVQSGPAAGGAPKTAARS